MSHTVHMKPVQPNSRQWKPKPKPRTKTKPIPMPKVISKPKPTATAPPQPAPSQNRNLNPPQIRKTTSEKFEINNHGKGNFYISKEMISKMTEECKEQFITDDGKVIDERLAFGYYKESVAMQINDNQIRIMTDADGKHTILIDIDLHFKSNGKTMYLVAQENAEEFRHRVRWCIISFMTRHDIYREFGPCQLPQSSRSMTVFTKAINTPPLLNTHQIHHLLQRTNFRGLPKKTNKRKDEEKETPLKKTRISEKWLKRYCKSSWRAHRPVPVVVIKGKRQWIEWKKFIRIEDEYGNPEWIGISLRYHSSSKQWRIECMDYNAGRIYYQHRLVGLPKNHKFKCSYKALQGYVTTSLEITNNASLDRRNQRNKQQPPKQQQQPTVQQAVIPVPAPRGDISQQQQNNINGHGVHIQNVGMNVNNIQGINTMNMTNNVNMMNGVYNNYDFMQQNNGVNGVNGGYNIMMNQMSNMTMNPYLPNPQPTNYLINNNQGINGHVIDAGSTWQPQQYGLHSNLCYNNNYAQDAVSNVNVNGQQIIGYDNNLNINNNYLHHSPQNLQQMGSFDDEKHLQMAPTTTTTPNHNDTDYVVEQIVADVSVDDVVDDVMKGYQNSTGDIMDEFEEIINDELGDKLLRDEDLKHLQQQFLERDPINNTVSAHHHQGHTQIVR